MNEQNLMIHSNNRKSRRSFLIGTMASIISGKALAAPTDLYIPPPGISERTDLYLPGSETPGIAVSPYLLKDIDQMHFVGEGTGKYRIRIIFTFGCPRSPELYTRIRPMLNKALFEWMPVPGINDDMNTPAAALFSPGASADTLKNVFSGKPATSSDADAASRQHHLFFEKIVRELFVETNRTFATPTLAYSGRDGEARIIRGSPDLGALRSIIASAR